MSARPFPLPHGVTEAEAKREAGIIADIRAHEQAVIVENERGPFKLYFRDPYQNLVEMLEVVRKLEAKGYEFGPAEWTRDRCGVIDGLVFIEQTGN